MTQAHISHPFAQRPRARHAETPSAPSHQIQPTSRRKGPGSSSTAAVEKNGIKKQTGPPSQQVVYFFSAAFAFAFPRIVFILFLRSFRCLREPVEAVARP